MTRVPTVPTEVPSQSNKARRRDIRNTKGKETVKLSTFTNDIILYRRDPKNS
jgi:hypothetical protein